MYTTSLYFSSVMSQDLVFPVLVALYTISLYFSSVMSHDPVFPIPVVFFSYVPAVILAVIFVVLGCFSTFDSFCSPCCICCSRFRIWIFPATVVFSFIDCFVPVSAFFVVTAAAAYSLLVAIYWSCSAWYSCLFIHWLRCSAFRVDWRCACCRLFISCCSCGSGFRIDWNGLFLLLSLFHSLWQSRLRFSHFELGLLPPFHSLLQLLLRFPHFKLYLQSHFHLKTQKLQPWNACERILSSSVQHHCWQWLCHHWTKM